MTLAEIQEQLRIAHRALAAIRDDHLDGVSPDTAFALGEALGHVRHAEALVARDMNNHALAQAPRHG